MTTGVAPPSDPAARSSMRVVAVAACAILLAHLWVALTRSINWDEFHHFDQIRQYAAGTLTGPLQTFHVHLFGWLPKLPVDPITQIIAGRLVMLGCLGGAALALFGVATRFVSTQAAALTALVWLTGGFVIGHGTAFRVDPPATMLLMASLWLLTSRALGTRYAIAAGALAGLAAAITIKTGFYAPAFAAIAWLRWSEAGSGRALRHFLIAGLGCLTTFALLYLWHRSLLPAAPATAGGEATRSTLETVFSEGFLPQGDTLWKQIKLGPHVAALLGMAPVAWWFARSGWARALVYLGLMLPLATLLFYRNAFPYYFVFILPPALVAAAPAIDLIAKRFHPAFLATALALFGLGSAAAMPRGTLEGQRQTIAQVDRLFPQPVTYIDFAGSLGSHRRAVPFLLSGWGLKVYHERGEPQLSQVMAREPVPLLIANHPVLWAALAGERPYERLIDADAEALRNNFVQYSGRIHLAGKRIPAGAAPIDEKFLVPGSYRLLGGAVTIDGFPLTHGASVTLARGMHRIAGGRQTEAVLRWGPHIADANEPAVATPPFDEF